MLGDQFAAAHLLGRRRPSERSCM